MTLVSRLAGLLMKLPPAETHAVVIERDLPVTMPDSVRLLGDHYFPRAGGPPPTLLVRSPYGRSDFWGLMFGQLFAERGFQVFIQSCRGTFGSGGTFDAFRNERADGLATLAWLKQQPWFSGELALAGPSYLGYVQWAVAADAGPELKALTTMITTSEFRSVTYAGGSFGLDTGLTWINQISQQAKAPSAGMAALARATRQLRPYFGHLPLRTIDEAVVKRPMPFFRDWLAHNEPGDAWWAPVDFTASVPRVAAPIHQLGGWYDIFLPQTLADYGRLRQAGRQPYLTIGPWAHTDLRGLATMVRESIIWTRAQVLGERGRLRAAPVRVYVMGANEWRDYPDWPPAGYPPQRWHLQPQAGLSVAPPAASDPDRYRYNPAEPTPAVGGVSLSDNSGPKDNRRLEARPDVLTYTSPALEQDVEIIGAVSAELFIHSSLEHTDFFARLCEVAPNGRSINVCDGLLRLRPGDPAAAGDGLRRIYIELWPTAYRFRRGHKIRVQVSSGAHPRFARNLGSGEPLATGTTLQAADQAVYHDPGHPSAILLPVHRP